MGWYYIMVNNSNRKMLKWLGGKEPLKERVSSLLEIYKGRWVDVFCGGCSLPLSLGLDNVWINDANYHLICFLDWVKHDGLIGDEYAMINDSDFYYKVREVFNNDEIYDCIRFYYLNQTCVNGVIRFNSNGGFNSPYGGKGRNINYVRDFSKFKKIMSNWRITAYDYKNMINDLIPGDILFIDPPYDTIDGKGFTNYFGKFDFAEQIRLAELAAKHDTVIACNSATSRIIELYSDLGFDISLIEMPRKVATNGNRSNVLEMFATKGF
jgi:DNA adenine methylase